MTDAVIGPINDFLHCQTPDTGLSEALQPHQEATLLIDHANCEKKSCRNRIEPDASLRRTGAITR